MFKRLLNAGFIALILASETFGVEIQKMNFEKAKLSEVLKIIAQLDNKNIMFGPQFKDRPISINITRPVNGDVLFNNILREYCLVSSNINGITVINSGKCLPNGLPSLSSLLQNSNMKGQIQTEQAPLTKTETIILNGITTEQAKDLIKPIKDIYSIYEAKKLGVLVVNGSPKAIKLVNKKLKPYLPQPPRPGESLINAKAYLYDINVENFEKLVSPYLSKKAVIIHEAGNQIILEDYPKNIENVLDYFSQYISLTPRYITQVLFVKKDLEKAYETGKACKNIRIDKSEEFKALIIRGAPQYVASCEKTLSPFITKAPRQNVIKSQTFYIKYIDLSKFEKLIKPYISDKAIITPIKNMNAVTIIDYIQNLEKIRKNLKQYISDKPIYIQINIKAIEISKNYQKQLGLGVGGAYAGRGITIFNTNNFSQTPLANSFSFTPGPTPQVTSSAVTIPSGLISGIYSEGKFHVLGFEIQALESINKAKSVFKSTLLAMNNQPTSLTQGIEYPFTTISTPGQAVPTVTLQNVLNSIKVTPQVLPNKKILLNINIQNMSLGPLAANGQPTINQNSNSLSIVLSDGSTLAIGGVGLTNKSATTQGIPGLDKVPVLGAIGMNKNEDSNDTNLFIFITAKRVQK